MVLAAKLQHWLNGWKPTPAITRGGLFRTLEPLIVHARVTWKLHGSLLSTVSQEWKVHGFTLYSASLRWNVTIERLSWPAYYDLLRKDLVTPGGCGAPLLIDEKETQAERV